MKNNSNTIMDITQVYVPEEDVKAIASKLGYIDTARKFTVYQLLCFLIASATGEWKSFRAGVEYATSFGLPSINYSTFSKKAMNVPFEVFKEVFDLIVSRVNHKTRRKLGLKQKLLSVDSTTISVGQSRLKWGKFHGEKSAIKLHVGYDVSTNLPTKVIETIARKHDGPVGEGFEDKNLILVEDRAYAKISRFDRFIKENQLFVIRIKKNFTLVQGRKLKSLPQDNTPIEKDISCYLGKGKHQSKNRIRVVIFKDYKGHEMRIATNILNCPPELIADIYKERWHVEQFFRFIKQNLNVKRLFGTSKNAVYSQLYCALIAYVLIHIMYEKVALNCTRFKLTRIEFVRRLLTSTFKVEVLVTISKLLNKKRQLKGKL